MNIPINDALGNVNFENGDFIKGQKGFSIYDQYLGWIGSLKFLQPTLGYMMKSNSPHMLSYPNPQLLITRSARVAKRTASTGAPWGEVVTEDYSKEMSFIAKVDLCNELINSDDYLGVFVGGECRGYIQPEFISEVNAYYFFLPASANVNNELLTFKYYNSQKSLTYGITESYIFKENGIIGSADDAYIFTVNTEEKCTVAGLGSEKNLGLKVFPNPFHDNTKIQLVGINLPVTVEVTDLSGNPIAEFEAANKEVLWNGMTNSGKEVSQGIYILSVHSNDVVYKMKVVKLK